MHGNEETVSLGELASSSSEALEELRSSLDFKALVLLRRQM
jgi:hypothetical protein